LFNSGIIFGLLAFIYFGFNLYLSGSLFPNTFSAKIKYYSSGNLDYWNQLFKFLSSGHLLIVSVFFAIGGLCVIKNILYRKPDKNLLYLCWIIGMAIAFSIFLPFLYQSGRYLMPVLPFYIIVAFEGLAISIEFITKTIFKIQKASILQTLLALIFFAFAIQFSIASVNGAKEYAETCRYINDRQVVTAKWLSTNLPKGAIVATHDIGAVGFYSERKIVDMVGLVSPEMIPRIGSFDALEKFLKEKKVTHLVALRNWFHLGNQATIYETDEKFPEVMEVFEYCPESVMFVPQNVARMNEEAEYLLSTGNIQQAGSLLNQSVQVFPRLAWTYFLIGQAYISINNPTKAEESFKNAIRLDSTYKNARDAVAQLKR
jgi:tetratricopeptide (TPR) repeat protein